MAKHLVISGHGQRRNGTFDPGATGIISKGEHRYVKEDLFPAMRKFLPKNHNVGFFDSYNVFDRGNIVSLARQYNACQVTEIHFDAAGSSSASGGHVIIHSNYSPDKMDLALRDTIKKMVGVRYSHKGYEGISGRNNLGNVNRTANANITYRMLELGFGTNAKDAKVLTEDVESYAKELVKTITGTSNGATTSKKKASSSTGSTSGSTSNKSISKMASEVIAGKHGSGHATRQKSLGINNATYQQVRAEVNRMSSISNPTSSKPKGKSITQMATEVINGNHGSGHANRRRSLGISQAQYEKVRTEVNKRAGGGGGTSSSKSISQMATEVIRGNHGTGHAARRKSLGINQVQYNKVRAEVNKRL